MNNQMESLRRLVRTPRMESPKVSPNARWVTWTWSGVGETDEVFVAPTGGEEVPLRLGGAGLAARVVSWSPDSRSVLVEREDDGDERTWLCRVDLDRPAEFVPLTRVRPSYFVRGGSLHPDGRTLVYGANVDLASGRSIEPTCVLRRDLVTQEEIELGRPARGGENVPVLSPTGDHVVYFRSDRHPAGVQVWLVGIDGTNDGEIVNVGDDLKAQASWFPDGVRLLILAETGARTHRRLGIWDVRARTLEWLVDDPALNIERAHAPRGSDRIVAWVARDARTHSVLIDARTGRVTATPFENEELLLLAPVSGDTWIAQVNATNTPSDLVRVAVPHAEAGPRRSIARAADRLDGAGRPLARAESVHWTSVDGREIQGWLYRPDGPSRGTIVSIHGGPTWHRGDEFDLEPQAFRAAGFTVLVPNYRGSTGFSLRYQEAIRDTGWGGLEQEDIRTGIEMLLKRGFATPGGVGVTGLSYGGYSTWHAVTHFPRELVAAGVPICGMTDLVMDYERTRPDLRPLTARMMGGTPAEKPELYEERSPIHRADRIEARLLIVQGRQDPNVPPDHVHAIVPRLDEAGVDYEVLWLEDEGHGVSKPENLDLVLSRMIAFFAEALSGQAYTEGECK